MAQDNSSSRRKRRLTEPGDPGAVEESDCELMMTSIPRKLASLHITLNKTPYYELNSFFIAFLEKQVSALNYKVGIEDIKKILIAWDMKAPLLLNDDAKLRDAINIIATGLIMKNHPLARCFYFL